MALLAIVLVFVALALIAFFLAMSGGRKRDPSTRRRGSSRGVTVAFLAVLLLLGIAIPVFAVTSERNRNTDPESSVREYTDLQLHGRELFGQRCRNCHTLAAANASATIGPNLDELRPPQALVLDAINNGRARGNGQMAADIVEGEDAEAVAQFVAVATGNEVE